MITNKTTLYNYIKVLRPHQWIKNVFILAPMVFSFRFTELNTCISALIAIICFICASGATYIINDVYDKIEDQSHDKKKLRPIAAGYIEIKQAFIYAIILILVSLIVICYTLPYSCLKILLAYLALNAAYNMYLKKQAVIDVLAIASGFVLRVLMGGYAINVAISPWIILATFLLALFLGFSKRYNELAAYHKDHKRHSLYSYNEKLLDKLIMVSCIATLTFYSIYTVEVAQNSGKTELVYTVLFVVYGLFRYLQAIFVNHEGGEPERFLFKDKPFLINNMLWLITTLWILNK